MVALQVAMAAERQSLGCTSGRGIPPDVVAFPTAAHPGDRARGSGRLRSELPESTSKNSTADSSMWQFDAVQFWTEESATAAYSFQF